jgi:hypothetical protein
MRQKLTCTLLAAALVGMLVLPGAALAGSKGRKNTALGLTGLAAYELVTGHTTTGVIAGAGAAYAWKRASDARKSEKRRARYARYSGRHHYYRTAHRYR